MIRIKIIIEGYINLILDYIFNIKYNKIYKERENICTNCEYNIYGFCKLCGCFLRAKTKVKESNCPINKWNKISENKNKN